MVRNWRLQFQGCADTHTVGTCVDADLAQRALKNLCIVRGAPAVSISVCWLVLLIRPIDVVLLLVDDGVVSGV